MNSQTCFIHPELHIDETDYKGRGVFCGADLAVGTVVEMSPVIVIAEEGKAHLMATPLHDYIFGWEHEGCCVGMGYLSLYNHSYNANCEYIKDFAAATISIRIVRNVEAGEELCINYNGIPDDQSPIWFEAE